MESSVAFEVSLTQDVDLFNFIHIFTRACGISSLAWCQGGRINPRRGSKMSSYSSETPPCIPCVFAMMKQLYYLYRICKLAVPIGKMPLYKMYANHK